MNYQLPHSALRVPRWLFVGIFILLIFVVSSCSYVPNQPYTVVRQLAIQGQTIYASLVQRCTDSPGGPGDCVESDDPISYRSQNQGRTWVVATFLPRDVAFNTTNDVMPKCTVDKSICYQIAGDAEIQISTDRGATWKRDWIFPHWRLDFMERYPNDIAFIVPEGKAYDLVILEGSEGTTVVVAMGNQGVLVKSSSNVWERYPVGLSYPIPFKAGNFEEATSSLGSGSGRELILAFLLQIPLFVLYSLISWLSFYIKGNPGTRKKIARLFLLLLFICVLSIIIYVYNLAIPYSERTIKSADLPLLPAIAWFLLNWLLMIIILPIRRVGYASFGLTILMPIVLGVSLLAPYYLWAFAIIPVHWVADIFAWITTIILFGYGFRALFRVSGELAKPATK